MTSSTPKALVFDFDGVILDTETAALESYRDIRAAHGAAFDRERFLRAAGTEFDFDPWCDMRAEPTRAALDAQHRARCDARIRGLPLLPGVRPLLEAATARGLQVGLASNSSTAYVEGHLRRLGLREHFDFLSCRESVARPKPAPDLYLNVLRHFGLDGSEAIAFEDSSVGTLAARKAGLWVVAVPNPCTVSHDLTAAEVVIPSLAKLSLSDLIEHLAAVRGAVDTGTVRRGSAIR